MLPPQTSTSTTAHPEIWVLLSGGIDSTAVLAFYVSQRTPVAAVFVDYGQAAAPWENEASEAVAKHYRVARTRIELKGITSKSTGEVPSRNAMLLALAAMEAPSSVWALAIGIHAGSAYGDCSPDFVAVMQSVLAFQARKTTILAPFALWHRGDILRFCSASSVPLALTYSCEAGTVPPCGQCLSCIDRKEL